jgi:hypothetical protein
MRQRWPSPHVSVHGALHEALQLSSHPHESPALQPRLVQSGACVMTHDSTLLWPHEVIEADVSGRNETLTPGAMVLDPGECIAESVMVPWARAVVSVSGSLKLGVAAQARPKATSEAARR